jgi:hypothetical protein
MNRIVTLLALAALTLGFVLPGPTLAQTAKDLAGTWVLISSIVEQGDNKFDNFGPNAKGVLMFDRNGRYVITFIAANLPKFASNDRTAGTADENAAIVRGAATHFGTYNVNEEDRSFTFRVEKSTFPNWDNTDQKRTIVSLTADELTYTAKVSSRGGIPTTTWKRVR